MTDAITLANATLILENEVIRGSVRMKAGIITDIGSGGAVPKGAQDMNGDFLAAGLVELHTDNLERHIKPRPKVDWPHGAAILAHDRELAGTGITTVFDAIRVGSILSGDNKRYTKYARQMVNEIHAMRQAGALRIRHHIHLRAEICSETLIDELAEFGADDRVGIVSLMDHTPGQRQFTDIAKFEGYVRGKHNFGDQEWAEYMAFLYSLHDSYGQAHEAAAVAAAKRFGATLASHDDTTREHVANSHAHGVSLAEFPTTIQAAEACHAHGIATIMGAPNLIRGGSHSGNVAALDLAKRDRLDILSSDYVPAGLLMGALQLGDLWGNMARGMATVTLAPAHRAGLADRGGLRIGAAADCIRFGRAGPLPVLHETWCRGQRVF